jgi:hypothetical protein
MVLNPIKALVRFWAIFVATATAMALALAWNGHRVAAQERLLMREKARNGSLAKLLDENRALKSEQLSPQEQRQLEEDHVRAQALRSRIIALQRSVEPKVDPAANGETLAKDWRYSGSATPKDALLSVLWAASRGDVDVLAGLIGFSPEIRPQVEAVFEHLPAQAKLEYGSPEKVVATLISGTFPKNASGASFDDAQQDDAEASVDMRVSRSDGQARTSSFQLDHASGGWRLLVPASVLTGYEKILQGEAPAPESVSP